MDMVERVRASRYPTRRVVLGTIAAGAVGGLAGCLGDDEEVPDPISLDEDGHHCDECNMVIQNHPGPVGQSFYLDDAPPAVEDREDGIAWFCSSLCMYQFILDHDGQGFEPVGSYGTDYSTVEYDLSEDGGATVITADVNADSFAPTDELTFVVDSDVQGAMGSSLIGFSDEGDANSFASEHDGELYEEDEISDELLAALGT